MLWAGLFDTLKRGYARMSGGAEAGVLPSITFGVVSAFMGQLVAFPLETVSRRMQVCPAPPSMVTQWLPPFPLVILFFDVFL